MSDRKYVISVKDTSDETILELLDFGTVDVVDDKTVQLLAKKGLGYELIRCKNVIKVS